MNSSILAYTAITGGRDAPRNDIPVYGDRKLFTSEILNAKIYKILPHLFFPSFDFYLWVDGNIFLTRPKEWYVTAYLDGYDMALFQHPERHSIIQELRRLRETPYYKDIAIVEDQVRTYREQGFSLNLLYENNFMLIKKSPLTIGLCEKWWAQITRWQYRDQISLPYVISHYLPHLKINTLEGNIRHHPDFTYKGHLK